MPGSRCETVLRDTFATWLHPKRCFPARVCVCFHSGHIDRNAEAWAHAMHPSPKCLCQLTKPRLLLPLDSNRTSLFWSFGPCSVGSSFLGSAQGPVTAKFDHLSGLGQKGQLRKMHRLQGWDPTETDQITESHWGNFWLVISASSWRSAPTFWEFRWAQKTFWINRELPCDTIGCSDSWMPFLGDY